VGATFLREVPMMVFLLVVSGLITVVGVGFQVAMIRRDEPALGMFGLMILLVAGVAGSAYGTLASV
jgi:hypothetical protein